MTDDDVLARRALRTALTGEPPLGIDLPALVQREEVRMRRRRVLVSTAGVAAVVIGAAAAVGLPGRAADLPAAAVPGCSQVVATDDPQFLRWARSTPTPSPGYEATSAASSAVAVTRAPDTRPLSPRQGLFREQVRAAIVDALPRRSSVVAAAPDDGERAPETYDASYQATVAGTVSTITVSVQPFDRTVPPCTPVIELRTTAADGLVADVYRPAPHSSLVGQGILSDELLVLVTVDAGPDSSTTITTAELAAIIADTRVRPPVG